MISHSLISVVGYGFTAVQGLGRAAPDKIFSACGATPEMRRRREFFGSKQCIKKYPKYSWLPMDIDYSSAVLCETIE